MRRRLEELSDMELRVVRCQLEFMAASLTPAFDAVSQGQVCDIGFIDEPGLAWFVTVRMLMFKSIGHVNRSQRTKPDTEQSGGVMMQRDSFDHGQRKIPNRQKMASDFGMS